MVNSAVRRLLAFPGAVPALPPSMRQPSLQHPASSLQQPHSSALEPLLEAGPSPGGSGISGSDSVGLPPGSGAASLTGAATRADSQGAKAAAATLLAASAGSEGAESTDGAGPVPGEAAGASAAVGAHGEGAVPPPDSASAAASSEAASEAGSPWSQDDYRRVELRPGSAGSGFVPSPLASPFQSAMHSRRLSMHSGDLDDSGRQAAVALPGAPTMPAATPLAHAATQASTAGSGAAAGRLGAALSEPSVHGPTALPGEPTLLALSPFVREGSRQEQLLEGGAEQQRRRQQLEQAAGSGSQDGVASSVGSTLPPGASGLGPLRSIDEGSPVAGQARDGSAPLSLGSSMAGAPSWAEDAWGPPPPMHPLCPLDDAVLPLDTASLKSRQLVHALEGLQAAETAGERLQSQLRSARGFGWAMHGLRSARSLKKQWHVLEALAWRAAT